MFLTLYLNVNETCQGVVPLVHALCGLLFGILFIWLCANLPNFHSYRLVWTKLSEIVSLGQVVAQSERVKMTSQLIMTVRFHRVEHFDPFTSFVLFRPKSNLALGLCFVKYRS